MKHNPRPERVEPTEDGRRLRVVWRDGHVTELRPRAIRLACPCAGCVDEFTGEPLLNPAAVPADINPVSIDYVGRYALSFTWPDGHDTGIYPWDLLRSLCPCDACRVEREARRAAAEDEPRLEPIRPPAGDGESVPGPADGAESSTDPAGEEPG